MAEPIEDYAEWVAAHVPQYPAGMCGAMTELMVAEFPALRRVRGHYVDVDGRQYQHWWCVTADGTVVDPTVAQFPLPGEYVERVGAEPTGRCLNCGEYCYDSESICSLECGHACEVRYGAPRKVKG